MECSMKQLEKLNPPIRRLSSSSRGTQKPPKDVGQEIVDEGLVIDEWIREGLKGKSELEKNMAWLLNHRLMQVRAFLPSCKRFLVVDYRPEVVSFGHLLRSNGGVANTVGGWLIPPVITQERFYSREKENYNLFGNQIPGDEEFRKAWEKEMDEDDCLWTASEDDDDVDDKDIGADTRKKYRPLEKEIKKIRMRAKGKADLIDGDESDELRSLCSESDDEMNLWSGSECDDDDDVPTEAHPNERSDPYIDKLFEFEETPKYRTIAEMLKAEKEPPELSPGKQARKLAVENALKKLKKGPDGRYINVWEVISDIDILIGAFENIVSGPEYAELREGGPKKLNMQFFKDIQARMRDPNFKFSPELKLKPKSKLVPKKKWQKAQARRRKNERR